MATIKVNGTSYFASADKITTPSLIIHDGIYVGINSTPGTGGADPHPVYLNAYIPLFRGNINSTVDYDRWRYTLGALKVGDYRAAVSRTSINHSPGIQILSYPSGITGGVIGEANSVRFTVTDIDNDLLTVKIYCTQNNPTSGSPYNFYQTAIKTYENVSSGSTISFSGYVPESGANGYYNMGDYILQIYVTDLKGGSIRSNYINIHKNANLFESIVFWVDFNTRYIGTYSDNGSTITITGKTGSGTPYQQFCGFDPKLVGKSLTWDVISNGSSIKSRWTQNCSNIDNNPVIVNNIRGDNIDGTTPENHYGVKICEGWVPNGEYDIVFTIIDGDKTYKYYLHIIMNIPDDSRVPTGDVVPLGTHSEQVQYLVGQTFNFIPSSDTAHNREIGSPILYPAGTDYHHVSETRYRITKVNKTAINAATISGVKLKFNSPDTGEWFVGFDKYGGVDGNTYNSTALAPIPYTIGSNITTPVATFKVTRVVELPSGARAVYGTHVSGIVS